MANREMPRTPEPMSCSELSESPRRQKLKRRMKPKAKEAPTNLFLESISAVDIAIPTVEVADLSNDVAMPDRAPTPSAHSDLLTPIAPPNRFVTPPPHPRTPNPHTSVDVCPQRPNWRATFNHDSPGCDTRSIGSDWSERSDKSLYSGTQVSNDTCTSPESDTSEAVFPLQGTREMWHYQPILDTYPGINKGSNKMKLAKVNHGLWSSEMNKHLWSTYEKYLDDPTVTPYDPNSPPAGVYRRVALEAIRTFKSSLECGTSASKSLKNQNWPHSTSETCTHLRGMVKRNARSSQIPRFRDSRSPSPSTPFKPRRVQKNRFVTPEPDNKAPFSTRNIAVALTTSTSESMQPDGPLARLGRDHTADIFGFSQIKTGRDMVKDSRQQRLGSPPFIADTYSPGSTKPETNFPEGSRTYGGLGSADAYITAFLARKQPRSSEKRALQVNPTDSIPRLKSPVSFNGSRSSSRRDVPPVCLKQRFMDLSEERKRKPLSMKSSEEDGALQARVRSRRSVITSDCFQAAPVLPPGWESGSRPTSVRHSTPVSSDAAEAFPRLDSSFTGTASSTFPREHLSKPATKSSSIKKIMRQRPSTFDSTYFKRFNEEQARLNSVHGPAHFKADEDHPSVHSDSEHDSEED